MFCSPGCAKLVPLMTSSGLLFYIMVHKCIKSLGTLFMASSRLQLLKMCPLRFSWLPWISYQCLYISTETDSTSVMLMSRGGRASWDETALDNTSRFLQHTHTQTDTTLQQYTKLLTLPSLNLCVCVYILWDAGLGEGLGPEAQHREDDERGKDRGEEVDGGDGEGVAVTVIIALVIGGVRYNGAKPQTQSKEHLSESLTPHLNITPYLQLRWTERGEEGGWRERELQKSFKKIYRTSRDRTCRIFIFIRI